MIGVHTHSAIGMLILLRRALRVKTYSVSYRIQQPFTCPLSDREINLLTRCRKKSNPSPWTTHSEQNERQALEFTESPAGPEHGASVGVLPAQ